MLQHYSYKVAENFNLLATLAPGRIDLGVGRRTAACRSHPRPAAGPASEEKGTFADQLAQLDNWLSLTEPGGEETRHADPAPGQTVSARRQHGSAELAARLDWNFVFAAHLNGDSAAPCRVQPLARAQPA